MRRMLVIIGTMLALLFVSQNLDSVEISLVVGRPVEAPLALILSLTFLGGFIAGVAAILGGRRRRGRADEMGEEDEDGEARR